MSRRQIVIQGKPNFFGGGVDLPCFSESCRISNERLIADTLVNAGWGIVYVEQIMTASGLPSWALIATAPIYIAGHALAQNTGTFRVIADVYDQYSDADVRNNLFNDLNGIMNVAAVEVVQEFEPPPNPALDILGYGNTAINTAGDLASAAGKKAAENAVGISLSVIIIGAIALFLLKD